MSGVHQTNGNPGPRCPPFTELCDHLPLERPGCLWVGDAVDGLQRKRPRTIGEIEGNCAADPAALLSKKQYLRRRRAASVKLAYMPADEGQCSAPFLRAPREHDPRGHQYHRS